MTDKESYANRLGKYLGDWSQDEDDTAFVEEAEALEAENAELNDALSLAINNKRAAENAERLVRDNYFMELRKLNSEKADLQDANKELMRQIAGMK